MQTRVAMNEQIDTALEKIVAALGSGDPRVQRFSNQRDAAATNELIQAVLRDISLEARAVTVALWLARALRDSAVVPDVVEVLRRRPDVAISAGATLAQIGSASDLSPIGEILEDPSAAIECRLGAARALAAWRDGRVGGVLKKGLQVTPQGDIVTSEIIQALAWAKIRGQVENCADDIRPYLRAESPDVRYSALLALGNLHAVKMIDDVSRLLDDVSGLLDDAGVTSRGKAIGVEARRVVRKRIAPE
jgi:HEAT repeat protein